MVGELATNVQNFPSKLNSKIKDEEANLGSSTFLAYQKEECPQYTLWAF